MTAPPGVGKTHATVRALATHGTRAVYVTPTHDLAMQVQQDMNMRDITTHYWRQGPSKEDECIKQEQVEFFRSLGYVIRWGPCLDCSKRAKCTYRELFTTKANESAQVLIITSWHLRRSDLWTLKALRNRPLVILDEDALAAVAAPVELTVERLQSFLDNLPPLRQAVSRACEADAEEVDEDEHATVDADVALAMVDIFRRAAEDILRTCATAGHGQWRPSETVFTQIGVAADRAILQDAEAFITLVRSAYDVVRSQTALPNMLADLRELLLEARAVHLTRNACCWSRRSSIRDDRQILMLDATAEPSVVEGVLSRPVEVINTPTIKQQATVYQIMDKLGTRAGNSRDLAHEQSWTIKLATEVARKHAGQSLLCVTFKNDEEQLTELLEREHGQAAVIHYGALRGLNAFEAYDVGLIIGRPMPHEAQLQLLAVAAFGREALDDQLKAPPLQWRLQTHDIGPDTWSVRGQQYDDARWQAVWRHVVTGELMQAIGRLRPLTNDATIYVVTNEPLAAPRKPRKPGDPEIPGAGALDVTAVYAAELFPAMATSSRRSDFQQRVQAYADAMASLAEAGTDPTNRAVCAKLGIKECNGFRYRKLAKQVPRPP